MKIILDLLKTLLEPLFAAFAPLIVEKISEPDTNKTVEAAAVPELSASLHAQLDELLAR